MIGPVTKPFVRQPEQSANTGPSYFKVADYDPLTFKDPNSKATRSNPQDPKATNSHPSKPYPKTQPTHASNAIVRRQTPAKGAKQRPMPPKVSSRQPITAVRHVSEPTGLNTKRRVRQPKLGESYTRPDKGCRSDTTGTVERW